MRKTAAINTGMKPSLISIALVLTVETAALSACRGGFEMRRATQSSDGKAQIYIIGGKKSNSPDWPATFVFTTATGGPCTSTAISSRVVLVAAHCIDDNTTGTIELDGKRIAVTCDRHPAYQHVPDNDPEWERKVSPDFALCILEEPLNGFPFENVNQSENVPPIGSKVRLLGFGCNQSGGTDGGFGVLYEGNARVTKAPEPPSYYTTTLGGAAVCYGDSGGGAYIFPTSTSRVLVAVNSKGDISMTSRLSTTGLRGFITWANSWSVEHKAPICGLHDNAMGCGSK
jgi:hypothetical protein